MREVRRTRTERRPPRTADRREANEWRCGQEVVAVSVDQPSDGDDSPHGPRSRLPLSNRAGREIGDLATASVPISKTEGMELREEVVFDTLEGVEGLSTQRAVEQFDAWYDDKRGTQIVVENDLGERTAFRTPNRFTPDYREMLYAKAQSLERGLRDRWGRLLHTAMLTFSCSTTDSDGNPRPLVDHLEELLESWEAIRRALSRTLDGREWEYLAILEPHESGHVHVHLGVFVKGPVVAEQFQSVIDAHLRNCDGAKRAAHRIHPDDPDDDGAVRVRQSSHPSRAGGVENLGAYLAAYMAGEYGAEATEMPAHIRAFYTAMWATGRQWFRPSNGAQELMKPDREEPEQEVIGEDWEMVGISVDGETDDVIEFDPAESAGVAKRTIRRDHPPPDRAGQGSAG